MLLRRRSLKRLLRALQFPPRGEKCAHARVRLRPPLKPGMTHTEDLARHSERRAPLLRRAVSFVVRAREVATHAAASCGHSAYRGGAKVAVQLARHGQDGKRAGHVVGARRPFSCLDVVSAIIHRVLAARIAAEFVLIVFRINEHLGAIRDQQGFR